MTRTKNRLCEICGERNGEYWYPQRCLEIDMRPEIRKDAKLAEQILKTRIWSCAKCPRLGAWGARHVRQVVRQKLACRRAGTLKGLW